MVSEYTIQQVRDLSIIDVVGHCIPLKRKEACCPFHEENTPSFRVDEKRNIFKCFGCSEGGDGIAFVMKHARLSFIESVILIANTHGITVEEDSHFTKEEAIAKKGRLEIFSELLEYCNDYFKRMLQLLPEGKAYLMERGFTDEWLLDEGLGYAPDGWKNLTTGIIERGWYQPGIELGIIATKEDNTYDVYRNRIIFPIHDRYGMLIGFAGRVLKKDDKSPKYINPKESEMYSKKNVWYGLDKAFRTIIQEKNVFVVEGYLDVLSMRKVDMWNVIAASGTALQVEQIRQLKPLTSMVTIMMDGDDAGQKKVKGLVEMCLSEGLSSKIAFKEGMDPDDLVREYETAIK